jgi:formylglycine-generating enzyme required for sulfatase activity
MSYKGPLASVAMAVVSIAAMCGPTAQAAQLQVANVARVGADHIRFDITWTDSWRRSWEESGEGWENWDAAWIFVKYRRKGDAGWSHATLSAKASDHSAPAGAQIDVGVTGTRGMGVFLYRSAEGKGAWTNKGVKLKWMCKDDKVAGADKVELFVHAVEMVYVPQGFFHVGGGGKLAGSFTEGSWKKGREVIPFKITSEAELKVAPEPGCLYGTAGMGAAHQIGPVGKLPAEFPKGYGAFYCMKYETSQGQYAEFLNQLTAAQALKRYPLPTIPARFAGNGVHTVKKTSDRYAATKPQRACNWVSWDDCTAYIDWAGLRPMTELEYEKACRGPLKPIANEYAWGSGTVPDAPWILKPDAAPPVPYPLAICGNVGRIKAGSTYWGIAAMGGHLRERTVTVGHKEGRLFTGVCGDGALTPEGFADVPGWPGPASKWPDSATAGGGFRGGPWYADKARLRVSDRFLAACLRKQRDRSYGFRGVRQTPQGKVQCQHRVPPTGFMSRSRYTPHIMYIVDRSGSMFDMLDTVKKELCEAISNLAPLQGFHVIMLADGAPLEKTPKTMAVPTDKNKIAFTDFLTKIKAEGKTDPVKGFNRAFDVLDTASSQPGKIIYFLTDGTFPDNKALLSAIRARNKKKDVIINTLLYWRKSPTAVKVMTQIAKESGGKYRYIDRDE